MALDGIWTVLGRCWTVLGRYWTVRGRHLDGTGLCWTVQDGAGQCRTVQDGAGLYWTPLDWTIVDGSTRYWDWTG
eukprot:13966706-Alexandrium_andersonii.AAC.1